MANAIPKASYRALKATARIICGDVPLNHKENLSPYRTQRALEEFFLEELGLAPDSSIAGGSRFTWTESWLKRANGTAEFRAIMNAVIRFGDYEGTPFDATIVAAHLNELLRHDSLQLVRAHKGYLLTTTTGIELPATPTEPQEILSDAYVREQAAKCDQKLAGGDLDGAVTNARTLLEAVLFE